jgi:hypothetical protein
MIDINQSFNYNPMNIDPYVTVQECLELTNSYIKSNKALSILVLVLTILVFILYFKREKENKGRQAPSS